MSNKYINKTLLESEHFKKCIFCGHLMRTPENLEYVVRNNSMYKDIQEVKDSQRYEDKKGYCNECSKFI